jgi:hypothetical protein
MMLVSEMILTVENLDIYYSAILNVVCHVIDLTFEHGLSPYSALGFAFLISNQYLSKKIDVDSAERFA